MKRTNRRKVKNNKQKQKQLYIIVSVGMLVAAVLLQVVMMQFRDDEPGTFQASRHHRSVSHQNGSLFGDSHRQQGKSKDANMQDLEQLKMLADQLGVAQGGDKKQLMQMAEKMGIR